MIELILLIVILANIPVLIAAMVFMITLPFNLLVAVIQAFQPGQVDSKKVKA